MTAFLGATTVDGNDDEIVARCRTSGGQVEHTIQNFPEKREGGRKLSDRTPERNNNDSDVESCLA